MSEFESPELSHREPTVQDVRRLMASSAPHFALHLRNRVENLIAGLPEDHPARIEGEREIAKLEDVALGAEHRGGHATGEPPMPSLREVPDAG
jgi:hypothetical protein